MPNVLKSMPGSPKTGEKANKDLWLLITDFKLVWLFLMRPIQKICFFFFLYLSFLFAVNNLAEFDMIHKIQNLSLHSNINKIYMYIFTNRI